MNELKVTGLAEVKDYYDKNYHRYSLILDYFILFSTIAEGERSEPETYFLTNCTPFLN